MPIALRNEILSFGPFRLSPAERLLTRTDERVELSGRAYDILLVLLSRPNELVSKSDLLTGVWPGISVEEGSLRFHIANLRKALGDGEEGARYIATSSGRGYTFVAQVHRSQEPGPQVGADAMGAGRGTFQHANLPARYAMVDREDDIEKLPARVLAARFVTVVGAGGIGKTTLAVAAGHRLASSFAGAVLFVDLSMVNDPALVGTILASLLGLSVQSEDATPGIVAHLKDKSLLLILDTCEHLAAAVARLASAIFFAAPNIHILATSREALQTEGETVYRLDPLPCPPGNGVLTADVALTFPAIQLFIERARASGAQLDFSDDEAVAVVGICRKLDGLALAIELAARRVKFYGVHQTAALLGERLTLSWLGPRNAPARQKTLYATMEWSYGLLTEIERAVLRRMAVFVGDFTLDAVIAVSIGDIAEASVLDAVDSLVAKSMVATRRSGAAMSYRLLDTTRAFARSTETSEADTDQLALRHAIYCRDWLVRSGNAWSELLTGADRAPHFSGMNNVRAALEWCFGLRGDKESGVRLAAAAAEVFLAMSLLPECHRWSHVAILALDDAAVGSAEEMRLQAGLGLSSSQMYGESDVVDAALSRSLAIAEANGDLAYQAGLLNMQHMFHGRSGNFKASLSYAQRCRAIAEETDDLAIKAVAHAALGRCLQFVGDLDGSRAELEALVQITAVSPTGSIFLGYDPHYRSSLALGRTLWLLGYPTQAIHWTREAVSASEASGHSAALALVLAGAGTIFLWAGDLASAQQHIDRSFSLAETNGMAPLMAIGRCRQAQLMIHRGKIGEGVKALQEALGPIHASRHELLTTEFNIELALGLAELGQVERGLTLVHETIDRVELSGELFQMPELLRVKGRLLCALPAPRLDEAEQRIRAAFDLAGAQHSRSWQLRAAMDLTSLVAGRRNAGMQLLNDVFAQYTEGLDTADVKAAARLLMMQNPKG
jgi:predicted ATPase/DNA-binding winged helix-turn-helix (wHTH) protein